MRFEDVAAELVSRGVALEAVWQLTRSQVRRLYFRERDDRGRLVPLREEDASVSHADQVRYLYRLRGWPEWKIDEQVKKLAEAPA